MEIHSNQINVLQNWRQQRAARVNAAFAKYGMVFALAATIVDLYFNMPLIVLFGDLAMILGMAVSLYYSRKKTLSNLAWAPLYTGIFFAISTSLAVTGGTHSSFFGGYLTLLFVIGLITQVRIRPLYVCVFVFANLLAWGFAEFLFPNAFNSHPPDLIFSLLINAIVVLALTVCLFEFLRTEKTLADEILHRYQELDIAQRNLNREEAANAMKTTFLANISHELRTPLGAILGYADLILEQKSSEKERTAFAETILKNGHQLLHLVDDLLDLTKVEAGKVEIEKIPFSPMQTLTEVIELLTLSAKKKDLELSLATQNQAPLLISSDPLRLRQILMNVIGNAIKFSEQGRVQVNVRHEPGLSPDSIAYLVFEIQDTGPGLSIPEQERLFKPFTQADASITRKYGGTGLGLNLSRHLARLLGGELELEWSQPGVGTRFCLRIPAQIPEENTLVNAVNLPAKLSKARVIPFGRSILVVEDNLDNQDLITRYLADIHAEIEVASDGLQAIQMVQAFDFDMILMDVQMPILDGLQTARLLRKKRFAKPIIALTAHAMKEDRDRCLEAGFDDYLTKPIDRNVLLDKIAQHLSSQLSSDQNLV